MKAHRSNRPVNRSNRPVNRSEPVARENLNLFEFGFEFNWFPPVTGLTGPVNRYRRAAVTGFRLGNKTLAGEAAHARLQACTVGAASHERRCHMACSGVHASVRPPGQRRRCPVLVVC